MVVVIFWRLGGALERSGERLLEWPATTGKRNLGVSDLIDKDTRAQGRRMTLEEEGA